ncbi:STAS domain-containing protein [Streptomyces crystallinus]|uniref:STAS domain-containing protein n=1 Tax=Streptomyces crystallinus TaxID=68191 RepID=A0ABN1FKE8_9ACTN
MSAVGGCTVPDRRAARVLRVTVAGARRTALVRVSGEIDIETGRLLEDALYPEGAERIIVDLSGCAFGDCTLLSVLLRARRHLEPVLAGPLPAGIQRLFDLTDTTKAFTITSDVSEALLVQRHGGGARTKSPCSPHDAGITRSACLREVCSRHGA